MMIARKALGFAAWVAMGLILEKAAWGVFDSAAVPAGTNLKVQRVVPEGNQVAAPGRQIVVTFDRPVKSIGDLSVAPGQSPVSVSPVVACQWHWLDPRSLACELNDKNALVPATRYTVTVAPGMKSQDGAVLEREYVWSFTTERPAVTQYSFKTWQSPGMPVIRLVFNQAVVQETVQSTLHFGGQKSVVAKPDPYDREVFYVLPLPGEPGAVVLPQGTPPAKSEARRVWLVSPIQELPGNTTVQLKVTPGLLGYQGPLPGTERRTVVSFDTFPEFRFLGVRCMTGAHSQLIAAITPTEQQPACNPFGTVSLVFSAPVIAPEVKDHLLMTPDLLNGRTDYDPWQNVYPRSYLGSPHKRGAEYTVELPEYLRAFQAYNIASLKGVQDEFGRPLTGPTTMEFRTDHRPPRLKVTHPVAVLEKNAPTSMPLFVTNLTDIDIYYRKITSADSAMGQHFNQPIDRVWDTAYAVPARIRDLLQGHSGVVTGYFDPHPSSISVDGYRYFDEAEEPGVPRGKTDRDFFAEVTPFQVHTKIGAYNTLVWVTSLDKGAPVAKARVRVFRNHYQSLTGNEPVLAESVTNKDGVALLPGRMELERDYNPPRDVREPLMVRVDLGGDLALLPLDQTFLVDLYRASRGTLWSGSDYGNERSHIHAWGTTAQGVYKLGDTVQYKVYVRDQNNLSLTPVQDKSGFELSIVDPTGKVIHTEPNVTLSQFGGYSGSFHVPLAGAVGWYEFNLKGPGRSAGVWNPMRVLIADFTPAPFQVSNTLNGQLFQPGDSVEVATHATLHAGGPYASASSRVTARLFPQALEISAPVANGFEFASVDPPGHCSWERQPDLQMVHQSDAVTSDNGEFTTQFKLPDAELLSARLEVESAVRDERGKYVANRSYAEFRGRDRYVGLHNERWSLEEGKQASIQYLVVDKHGQVVQGEPVSVAIEGQIVKAARVKGAGTAYLTSYQPEWQADGSCTGTSGTAAQSCTFVPSHPGLYSIMASVKDTHGNIHKTEMCTWVTGKGRVLWEEPADMSLSLIPEKPSYKVAEHARYLVKNPFPGAKALITIERYGVIKQWVQVLSGNTPVIDFKIEPDFVPGFYLSVVVTSPRAAEALNEEGVDLGRPTYRIGYLKVDVVDPYETLGVRVKSDRASYKPRDTVKLQLAAASTREPVEFAVAVLDEAVFDLIKDGKSYFDPYKGLYHLDDLDLSNYSLLTRLIGLQKFEKKGANSGGDGGAGFDMRTVDKYVAYWNPSLVADKRGRAAVSFQLPDNLTGWRVFAIAVTPGESSASVITGSRARS